MNKQLLRMSKSFNYKRMPFIKNKTNPYLHNQNGIKLCSSYNKGRFNKELLQYQKSFYKLSSLLNIPNGETKYFPLL